MTDIQNILQTRIEEYKKQYRDETKFSHSVIGSDTTLGRLLECEEILEIIKNKGEKYV